MPFKRIAGRFGAALALFMVITALAACSGPRTVTLVPQPEPVDYVLVEKGARALHLIRDGQVVHSYRIALGRNPIGPKQQEGDGRTPEGLYYVDGRNPNSRYHLSLHISYPGPDDRARAQALGIDPGRDIMIHGLPNGISEAEAARHPEVDWTDGCIAVTNREIEQIWRLVADGTLVMIRP